MTITTVPAFPLRSAGLSQDDYSAGVEASLSAIPQAITDLNAVGSAYALATNATSSTSVLIGTGSKSFTTQTNLGYQVGQTLRIANTSANYMTGDVTSYNTGTGALVMNITSVAGSGTFASWFLSQSAVGASSAGTVSFTPAGNIAATNVQSAIQELDTEKLSSAAGAVTSTNLASILTGATVGASGAVPVITYNAKGQITSTTTALPIIGSRGYYESAQQTITAAGALTLAHGLGVKPVLVKIVLQCTTAEYNYSIGDEVTEFIHGWGAASRGVTVTPDATNLNVRFGSTVTPFAIFDKTTGAASVCTNASWRVVFRAWA